MSRPRLIDFGGGAVGASPGPASGEAPPTAHNAYLRVHRIAYGNEEEARETIDVPLFATEVARVRVSSSVTRNLGDFNSAKVEVSIDWPCYPERSEAERTYAMISTMLDEMIPAELEKAITPPDGQI